MGVGAGYPLPAAPRPIRQQMSIPWDSQHSLELNSITAKGHGSLATSVYSRIQP